MEHPHSINRNIPPPEAGQSRAGFLGLLKLDTRFPRLPGDLGLPASWPYPVREQVVAQAWPNQVVQSAQGLQESPLLAAFVQAAQDLAAQGARAITTSCGFLVLWQAQLQAAVPVPVVSSSLCLLPDLLAQHDAVGVLTIAADVLGSAHWQGAGVPLSRVSGIRVQGLPADSHFVQRILGNQPQLDGAHAQREVVAAALGLRQREPGLHTLVLECTNLPPYAQAIAQATGWRVLSLRDSPVLHQALAAPPIQGGATLEETS